MQVDKRRVLIVDDEEGVRSSLRLLLKSHFEVSTASDGNQALELVGSFDPEIILLDVMMPSLDGIQTLRELKSRGVSVPVIMLTAANTVKTAVEAMKLGAVDYLNKPFDVESLTSLIVETLSEFERLPVRDSSSSARKQESAGVSSLIGSSSVMKGIFSQVEQVASKDTTVLITGESGTGKELFANRIHQLSARSDKPFVAINCAAIPETLIESELFGHERGAFTSAVEQRIGHFELADGGTLFLDEIGELSLQVQVKMLRFLQEQEFFRVGSTEPIQVDVRIIAATNRSLEDLIKAGTFRQDLYYRINVINLQLPALRDRFEDIPALAKHFVEKFQPHYDDRSLSFEEEALETLVQYSWPGNVRELENVIESLMALSTESVISKGDLPPKLSKSEPSAKAQFQIFGDNLNFEEAEKRFEEEMILKALKKTNYVQTRAAELLGISRRILKYKMDKLGITERLEQEKGESPGLETPSESGGRKAESPVPDQVDTVDSATVESATE